MEYYLAPNGDLYVRQSDGSLVKAQVQRVDDEQARALGAQAKTVNYMGGARWDPGANPGEFQEVLDEGSFTRQRTPEPGEPPAPIAYPKPPEPKRSLREHIVDAATNALRGPTMAPATPPDPKKAAKKAAKKAEEDKAAKES